MAESVRRRSWGRVLPWGRHASISGSSLIHCASVSMAPPRPRGAKRPSSQPVQARTGPSWASRSWVVVLHRKPEATHLVVIDDRRLAPFTLRALREPLGHDELATHPASRL